MHKIVKKFAMISGVSVLLLACTSDPVKIVNEPSATSDTTQQSTAAVLTKYGPDAKACLVKAMYFEARGTGYKGMRAVGEVILNRSDSSRFPNGACNVLNQYYNGTCQFSFICDGIPDRYREFPEKARAESIAEELLNRRGQDITSGAPFFHAKWMRPGSWFNSLHRIGTFGGNIFYK